jgi:hypothetical protein
MSTSIKNNILTLQVQNPSYVDRELDLFNWWVTEKKKKTAQTKAKNIVTLIEILSQSLLKSRIYR